MGKLFEDRLHRLIGALLPERKNDVLLQLQKMKEQHSARGLLQSGVTVQKIKEILSRELEAQSILIWNNIVRVYNTIGIESDENAAVYFKDLFGRYHERSLRELQQIYDNQIKVVGRSFPSDLEDTSVSVIRKHDVEIDLFVDSLSKGREKKSVGQKTNYNFYGTVGVVQSGAGAQANLVQHLGETEKQDILKALEDIKCAIIDASNIDDNSTAELIEIVDDSVTEINKTNPNNSRLRAYFDALSGSIQMIANAGPAYQAFKSALLPLGITLP